MARPAAFLLTVAFFLGGSWPAHGEDDPLLQHPITEVHVGGTAFWLDYKEAVPPGLESHDAGILPGGYLSIAHASTVLPVLLSASMEFLMFDTQYNATLGDGRTLDETTSNTFFRFQTMVGYNLLHALAESTRLYVHVGLGYESWVRDLGGPTPHSRSYRNFPLPIGVRVDWQAARGFRIGADAAFVMHYAGRVKYHLSETGLGLRDLEEGDLGFGLGFKGSVFLNWYFTDYVGLTLEPFYEFIQFGEADTFQLPEGSPEVVPPFSPESQIHRVGGRASIVVRF